MTLPFPASRAAEEFDRIVDGIDSGANSRFAPLMPTVTMLREAPQPVARPEFVTELRAQLMAAAETDLVPGAASAPTRIRPRTRRERRLGIAAATVVLLGGSAGVAAAAQGSLPGDPLYPLKRGIEQVQVSVHANEVGRGEMLLDHASTRLDELTSLVTDSSTNDPATAISSNLESFRAQALQGSQLLFDDYERNGDAAGIDQVTTFTTQQLHALAKVSELAPPTLSGDFDQTAQVLLDLRRQALSLCGTCDASGAGDVPAAFALASSEDPWPRLLAAPVADAVEERRLLDAAGAAQGVVEGAADNVTGAAGTAGSSGTPGTAGTASDAGSSIDGSTPGSTTSPGGQLPSSDGDPQVSTSLDDVVPGLGATVGETVGGVVGGAADGATSTVGGQGPLDETLDDVTDPLLGGLNP